MTKKFRGGDFIAQDVRGEDPLVYYVPAGDWTRAIGILIDPLHEEQQADTEDAVSGQTISLVCPE